jgi:predicted 3-demethylubiquinone-9 3-methyltransferase (glyoxalase superfamily)
MQKITPFLWFDNNCEEAINFYISVFDNSRIVSIKRYPEGATDEHMKGKEGKVLTAVFELNGQTFMALDGGPYFKFNPAVSFMINCETPEQVTEAYNKLSDGGAVLMPLQKYEFSEMYSWVSDKYGLSWQIGVGVSDNNQRITPSFMFVGDKFGKAEEAINFYVSTFKNAAINFIAKYEAGEQDQEGKVKFASFNLENQQFAAMESSFMHQFTPNASISQYIECEDQTEVDYYWDKLTEGSDPVSQQCGWVQDKYGFSWQVIPKALPTLMTDPDIAKVNRVVAAMMKMKKIIVADLEAATQAE